MEAEQNNKLNAGVMVFASAGLQIGFGSSFKIWHRDLTLKSLYGFPCMLRL